MVVTRAKNTFQYKKARNKKKKSTFQVSPRLPLPAVGKHEHVHLCTIAMFRGKFYGGVFWGPLQHFSDHDRIDPVFVGEQTTMSPTSASLPEHNLILRSSQNLNIPERMWGTVCPTMIREAISCTQPRHTSAEKKK